MKIENKKILITGGSNGLGLALTQAFIDKQAVVHICSRNKTRLEKAAKTIQSNNLHVHQCDVSDSQSVKQLVKDIGTIDILINNAGVYYQSLLEKAAYAKIDEQVATNLLGVMYTSRAVIPGMLKQDSGYIVNVSSTSGLQGRPEQSIYCATKFGVRGFTEALSAELWQTGVFVMGFYPGGMQTDLFKEVDPDKSLDTFMEPAKVAEVVLFAIERDQQMAMNHLVLNRRR